MADTDKTATKNEAGEKEKEESDIETHVAKYVSIGMESLKRTLSCLSSSDWDGKDGLNETGFKSLIIQSFINMGPDVVSTVYSEYKTEIGGYADIVVEFINPFAIAEKEEEKNKKNKKSDTKKPEKDDSVFYLCIETKYVRLGFVRFGGTTNMVSKFHEYSGKQVNGINVTFDHNGWRRELSACALRIKELERNGGSTQVKKIEYYIDKKWQAVAELCSHATTQVEKYLKSMWRGNATIKMKNKNAYGMTLVGVGPSVVKSKLIAPPTDSSK